MEELQTLIDLLKSKKENANRASEPGVLAYDLGLGDYYKGAASAFSFCITELEFILKTGRKQQPLE